MKLGDRWYPGPEFYEEGLCTRCGVCCGATDGDPCEKLRQDGDGRSFCAIYQARLGERRTAKGHVFDCVQIQRVVEFCGGYECCAYVKAIRRERLRRGEPTDDLGRMRDPLG